MLLLVDLDNTLVDRASAFNRWANDFIGAMGGTEADADWLIAADRDGYEPREGLARSIKGRFKINASVSKLIQSLLYEHVDHLTMDSTTAVALRHARVAGYAIGIVTNGTTLQQNLKIQTIGLEAYVDCVVVSESVGFRKPDPEIFRLAARRLGAELVGGWMIGDHPTADISGGNSVGLKTGWVSRGRKWPSGIAAPTLTSRTAAEVIDAAVLLDVEGKCHSGTST